MNTPRLWKIPDNYPNRSIGMYDDESSPDRYLFTEGKILDRETIRPIFTFDAPSEKLLKFDVLPNDTRVPLVSARAASLLNEMCPHDFQLIPARIRTPDILLEEYCLLNVVANISGIDHERSVFSKMEGPYIVGIEQLRYREGAMGKHDLARERDYDPFLWASEKLIKIFAREKIRACKFEAPEDLYT